MKAVLLVASLALIDATACTTVPSDNTQKVAQSCTTPTTAVRSDPAGSPPPSAARDRKCDTRASWRESDLTAFHNRANLGSGATGELP